MADPTDPTAEEAREPEPSADSPPPATDGAPAGSPATGDVDEDVTEAAASDPLAAAEDPLAAAEDPLAAAAAERDDFLDQLMRARADYDNLNKRRHREVAEARDRGAAHLAGELLEVLDNFGFALRAAEGSADQSLAKGVELVHSQLLDALRRAGLQEVPGVGETFDPAHHEALMSESDDTDRDHPEVGEVLRTGYLFKSTLLRPASVKVLE